MSANSLPNARFAGSRLYAWMAVVAALIVFAGFARTFYLGAVFQAPALSGLLLAHGVVMTLWFALFFVQVRLVAAGRADLHRRLGVAGAVVAILVLAMGAAAAIDAGRRGASPAPGVTPLMFMAVPLAEVVIFALLVGTALWNRRRADIHRRLMLLATVGLLTPAVARIPLEFIRQGGLPVFFAITIAIVILCVAVDTVRNRRLHPAFGWGAALVIVSVPLRLMLAGTPAWQRFAAWLIA